MHDAKFRPSQVRLWRTTKEAADFSPLQDTVGQIEQECAVASIVRLCQLNGDRWQHVTTEQLAQWLNSDDVIAEGSLWRTVVFNPFCTWNYSALVGTGLAEFNAEQGTMSLTEKALTLLERCGRVEDE